MKKSQPLYDNNMSTVNLVEAKQPLVEAKQPSTKETISICIPSISESIPRTKIFQTFCQLKWGHIDKIVEIPLKKDIHSKRAIIRIKWSNDPAAIAIKEKLKQGITINIVYDLPWYWRASLYTPQPTQYQPIIYQP